MVAVIGSHQTRKALVMYRNKDESITVQLKDHSELLLVLSKHDYWDSYYIETFYNKHDGIAELLKHKEVREYVKLYITNKER